MQAMPLEQPEDNLAAMHKKAKKRKQRKLAIISVTVIVVVLVVLLVGIQLLQKRVSSEFGSEDTSQVQSYTVTTGSISTTVSASGILAAEDVEEVELESGLVLLDVYVETGDQVEKNQLLATVTSASLTTAMSNVQIQLDELDDQIADASGDTVSSKVTAGASGRVKAILVEEGDDVATAMYEHGGLVLLSLDGYLAVDIQTDALIAGDGVSVKLSDGSMLEGTVEKSLDGTATILVTDDGTPYGETVTVLNSSGNTLGSSILYIHSQLIVTGYAGTVSAVNVSENQSVSASKQLLKLTDTQTSVSYDALLKERRELEEQMNRLIAIYKMGGICAPIAGTVESITETSQTSPSTGFTMQTDSAQSENILATISPEESMSITISVDETDILSLSVGQSAAVTIDSIGEQTYTGTLTQISTVATSGSGVSVYSAVVTLEKAEGMLSGMSADVVITIQGVDNAVLIPVDALHQTRSTSYVYTQYDEQTGEFSGMTEVTTGLQNSSYVEITAGLSEGDVVYYTQSEEIESFNGGFGNMGGMGNMSGDGMSGGSGGMGNMSDGGASGGNMPGERSSGGNMPGGFGG